MDLTPGMKAAFWERMALAALPMLMASDDRSVEEAADMAIKCADRLTEGYTSRFQWTGRQEEEICLKE